MNTSTDKARPPLKNQIPTKLILIFLCFWLFAVTGGMMSGGCRNERYSGETKLWLCNISLVMNSWTLFSDGSHAKISIIHLEKGIALSQLGQNVKAQMAFKRAIGNARIKNGPWEGALDTRITEMDVTQIDKLWISANNFHQSNLDF